MTDTETLVADLRHAVRGAVRFDATSRALYAVDASNYRHVPIGVVVPSDVEDVIAPVAVCAEHDVPVLPRGGGTSLAGQTCNVAVLLDCSKHLRGVVVDSDEARAHVLPGTVLDELRDAAQVHGLTFGPDPSTHNRCTLGGMIGNNSCGVHSVMAGRTADNVESLDIVTYDGLRLTVGPTTDAELDRLAAADGRTGDIYRGLRTIRDRYGDTIRQRFPQLPRRVSGYNLDELLPERGCNVARALVGTEGTCVTVLGATVRLVPNPKAQALLVIGFADVFDAAEAVPVVLRHGVIGLEGMDAQLVNDMRQKGLQHEQLRSLPKGSAWLLAETGADTPDEAEEIARAVADAVKEQGGCLGSVIVDDPDEEERFWLVRESGLGATASVPGRASTWEGWEDSAVPPERLADYLRDFKALLERYGHRTAALYGHFGDGCVHTRIDFDLQSVPGIAAYRAFAKEAAEVVLRHGGSLSGEHGDGQSRAELLARMFGDEIVEPFCAFKAIWDPRGRMNPGKVVDPRRLDDDLRLGTRYRPIPVTTHFAYPEDAGSFAKATLRCVGVGLCRRTEGGTMCPSYKVTLDEQHSTRGRARLLFEMMEGEVVTDGWRDEGVKEALDLCLSCKGCKSDCPVGVDMATYKAEFLSHHYARRLRPRQAFAIGLIHWWARLASVAPRVANIVTAVPGLRTVAKAAAGVSRHRRVPRFARRTFRADFARRPRAPTAAGVGRRVLLWVDTFNDNFSPEVLRAGVEVLEDAGFVVDVPTAHLCCGRPLYDYGFLGLARRLLARTLDELREDIRAGVPVVGLEPSCVAVFRDELLNLFPNDEDARRMSKQTFVLSEFLADHAPDWRPPSMAGTTAVVQGHCHHRAVLRFDAEESLFDQMGMDTDVLGGECCGMAGSFGFEADHYDVSMAVGELAVLPAVRAADASAVVVADGFSRREQIRQGTDRRAVHVAELIQQGLRDR
ncbi:FAD-binding and (Fe-S)-binding domain-containing protein [soil metagenome]